jgi:hypothetical protein
MNEEAFDFQINFKKFRSNLETTTKRSTNVVKVVRGGSR